MRSLAESVVAFGVVRRSYTELPQMRKAAANFEAVRVVGREFPDLCEGTMYGSPALKRGKRLVACVAIHRSAEPGSLVVRTDFEQRSAFLDEDPGTYYITDHYAKHPVVLVRLARLQPDQLRDLIAAGRQCVLTDAARSRNTSRGQRDQGQVGDDNRPGNQDGQPPGSA
ncbi:MAG: hypothetical protein ACJ746_22605 [Bryobacteraceae bacterium]